MTALVTGGGGFLGFAIVSALRARGEEVRTFCRGRYPQLDALDVDPRRGDLADLEAVLEAADGCSVVYHVAAKAGVWGARAAYEATNVQGTENVITACTRHAIPRLIYTSSPSVVFSGANESGIDEQHPYPSRFLAHYPRTKAIAERRVMAAAGANLRTVALRPHLIWGPGDPHLVPRILARGEAGRLRLIGSGTNRIDSTYIDNAANAHLLAADRLALDPALSGRAYFISNAEPIPIAELINRILDAGGLPPVNRSTSPALAYALGMILEGTYGLLGRTEEPLMTRFLARQLCTEHWYDLGAAQRDFGYTPAVSLDTGMQHLRRWLADHGPAGKVEVA